MIRRSILTGAIFAGLAVIIGAFGAHGLDPYVQNGTMNEHDISSYETGVRYQFYHAIALLVLGMIAKIFGEDKLLRTTYTLFTLGIIFFSVSIYILSTRGVTGLDWSWLGPVTPLGGVCFIAGWILIAISFLKNKTA